MRWTTLAVLLASTSVATAGVDDDPTRVTGRLDGHTAKLTARFSISVGPGSNQTLLELPAAALVTGARVSSDGAAHRLELMKADVADARFDALTVEKAGRGAKRSAVRIASSSGRVSVSAMSPRAGRLVIDLEIAMPTCFYRDTRWAVVPWSWDDVAARSLRLRHPEPDGGSLDQVCGRGDDGETHGTWIGFASTETARRRSGDRVSVSADRVDLGDESFVRLEIDVASMLADVPRDLATVVIVDGSRSLSIDDRGAQRALVASYLAKAPRSRVQVVSFARTALALLPAWTDAANARASVDQALRSVVPRNGSNFDAAFAEAATWLARTEGTRRVVLVTDQRMATRLSSMSDASLQRLLPAGTLLQVVVMVQGTGLTRDNDVRLASLATLTGGMATTLGRHTSDDEVDATMLVRPVSLDRLEIVAPGWEPMSHEHGAQSCTAGLDVVEGKACTWWATGRVGPVTIEGWVWGKRLTRVVTPDRSHDVDVARELSTSGGLTDDVRKHVDTRARAVNSTWSLYAAWGGTEGYDDAGGGGTGWGTICGCGRMGTIGHGSGTGSGYDREPALDLRAQLLPALESCNIGDAKVTVAVELTDIEIADVHVTAPNVPTAERQRVEACVADVVWASSPTIPRPRDHQLVSFTVGP